MVARQGDERAPMPWGWRLRARGRVLEDDKGDRWDSVRDAYWQGELGFPSIHVAPEQHELLLRILTMKERRHSHGGETTTDLFGGDDRFWRFYMCWLASIGLLDLSSGGSCRMLSPFDAPLSDEGRSVMLMLQATRDPDWIDLPFSAVVEAVRKADRRSADDDREQALKAFERDVVRLPHVFARERVHSWHLVTLTGIGTGARMPVRRVMWSQSCKDERARDDLFAWMAERVDRWEDWGTLAYSKGAEALTRHLFEVAVASGGLAR